MSQAYQSWANRALLFRRNTATTMHTVAHARKNTICGSTTVGAICRAEGNRNDSVHTMMASAL